MNAPIRGRVDTEGRGEPMKLDLLFASIEESFARVAALARPAAWQGDRAGSSRSWLDAIFSRVAAQSRATDSGSAASMRSLPAPSRPMRFRFSPPPDPPPAPSLRTLLARLSRPGARRLAVAALAVAALLLVWRMLAQSPAPHTQAATVSAPPMPMPAAPASPAAPARTETALPSAASGHAAAPPRATAPAPAAISPRPVLEIITGIDSGTDSRIAAELLKSLSPGFDLRLSPQPGWSAGVAEPQARPRLALVRYDALQAAWRDRGGKGEPGLSIVTPLYAEELHFLVRSDSPLRYVHEIEGRRINVGPPSAPRALTATTAYERLFGKPIETAAPASRLDEESALAALLQGDALDVIVVVGAQPAAWLADLEPDERGALKLLGVDRDHPASRAALRSFLPARLQPASYPGWLAGETPALAVMSFLVTAARDGSDPLVGAFAEELCRNLPALRRDGHPKWREVQPGLRLEAGWPYSSAAGQAFHRCRTLSSSTGGRP